MRSCIVTLLITYPVFVAAGACFYRYVQKTKPQPFPPGDPRNRAAHVLRFVLYILLLPLGALAALAVLGFLDPLFHLVVRARS